MQTYTVLYPRKFIIIDFCNSQNRKEEQSRILSRLKSLRRLKKTDPWLTDLSALPITGLFFWWETTWTQVLTGILEKTEFSMRILESTMSSEQVAWEVRNSSHLACQEVGSKFAAFTNGRQWIRTGQ